MSGTKKSAVSCLYQAWRSGNTDVVQILALDRGENPDKASNTGFNIKFRISVFLSFRNPDK